MGDETEAENLRQIVVELRQSERNFQNHTNRWAMPDGMHEAGLFILSACEQGAFRSAEFIGLRVLLAERIRERSRQAIEGYTVVLDVASWLREHCQDIGIRWILPAGEFAEMRCACDAVAILVERAAAETTPTALDATHSEDFSTVDWYGTQYTFSKGQQAEAVKALWIALERGLNGLSQQIIADKIDSNANMFRLVNVFREKGGKAKRMHPAWGKMIQPIRKGVYGLIRPDSAQ